MNRNYELMFIARPDMVDEDLNKLISTLESSVTSAGGTTKSSGASAVSHTGWANSTMASLC
jgi:hypothetical protein